MDLIKKTNNNNATTGALVGNITSVLLTPVTQTTAGRKLSFSHRGQYYLSFLGALAARSPHVLTEVRVHLQYNVNVSTENLCKSIFS